MRKLLLGLLIVLLFTIPTFAQEATAEPITPTDYDQMLTDITEAITQAEQAKAEAEKASDLAFNLLGLFEAISFLVTVGGVALAGFGFTRFTTASNELAETRKLVENELEQYRQRFETAIADREAELKALRAEVLASAERERQNTSNALLANALIPLGERQYRAADYTGATNTYQRALELDPINPVVNQRLGYVYTQSGQLDKAREHYQKAIDREPDFAPALAGLGFVFRRLGERIDRDIESATGTDEEKLQLRIQRDQLLNRSEEYLLQALKISPKLVDDDGESWWGVLGSLYRRRGQLDQAIEAYQQATSVTPQSSYGFGNLALLYMKQHNREKMLETYKRVEQIASKEADAEQGNFWGYADLIVSSLAIGKAEQGLQSLPIAISIAPIDSPYMLEGLRGTLQELLDVLEIEKKSSIQKAISVINDAMQERAKIHANR